MKSRALLKSNFSPVQLQQRPASAGGGPSLVAPPASKIGPPWFIAREEGVHRSTVQHWIDADCPVVRLGEVGRGRGALLDLAEVRAWRVAQLVPGFTRDAHMNVLSIVETAMLDALKRDDLARCARVTDGQAMLIVMKIFERLHLNVRKEPLTRERISGEMKRLCALYIESVVRDEFQRR